MTLLDFKGAHRRAKSKALCIAGKMWDHVYGLDKGKLTASECALMDRLCKEYSDAIEDYDFESLVDCVTQEFGEIAFEFACYIRRIECDRENCSYHDQITEYGIIREIADQYYKFVVDETTNEDLLTYAQDEDLTDIFDEWIYFFTH